MIRQRIMDMSKQELFYLRDALAIVCLYVDLVSLTEIYKEVQERLNQMAQKGE